MSIKLFVVGGVAVLVCADAAQAQQAVQWKVADGGNGHWYQVVSVVPSESPEQHFDRATSLGGHTATLASPEENSFCFTISAGTDPLIGVRKQNGNNVGAWVTSEPWQYSNWHGGEGNNSWERYVLLNALWSGQWQDTDLTPRRYSLVEWDADCNNDNIVDYGQILAGEMDDSNTNGIPDICECGVNSTLPACCPGDLSGDHVVDGADIGLLLSSWGFCGANCPHDLNNDGKVNGGDLGLLLSGWGNCGG